MGRIEEMRSLAHEDAEGAWIFPDIEEEAPARAWTRSNRTTAAALLVAALVSVVGVAAWCKGPHAQAADGLEVLVQASEEGQVVKTLAAGLQATPRKCVELPDTRLANGDSPMKAIEGETAAQCMQRCRADADCEQVIFSKGNNGCYRFRGASAKIFQGSGFAASDFTSGLCGSASDEASLQSMALQVRAQKISWEHESEQMEVQHKWASAKRRAQEALAKMTLDEKVSILHGSDGGMGYAGFLKLEPSNPMMPPVPDWMNLQMNDGPQGYNTYQAALSGTSTQMPCLLSVAASFSREVSAAYGGVVAEEFILKGSNVLLGPDVEVMRAPLTGRSFETISGEDPYLGSQLVAPFVKEVQSHGVIATVKHWLNNNQEIYRQTMDAEVADRTQHEVYMAPFKAAFDAGAGAVMCSYNKVYGTHACENDKLLKQLLREDLGFQGFVVSDWGATHDATKSANNGLDIEMPAGGTFLNLTRLVKESKVPESTVNEMATHVLSAMYVTGLFDGAFPAKNVAPRGHVLAGSQAHSEVALRTIIESTVLLKNEGQTLPIPVSTSKIAMVGKFCNSVFEKSYAQGSVYSGGGSGFVNSTEARTYTPLEGLRAELPGATIEWSVDASASKGADVTVVCASAHSEEGWDRKDLLVPEAEKLIAEAKKEGGDFHKVVVLAMVPGAVTTEWIAQADAALLMFMPGEMVGNATAKLLTGAAAPSGRLPVSLPKGGETRLTQKQYPGECPPPKTWCEKMTANFSEGVLIGYRWNDAMDVPAAYPFGYGLTYTTFQFKDISATCLGKKVLVTLKLANVGARGGEAVPQVYVGFPSLRPALRQLRGFQKVHVNAGEEASVVFVLTEEDWSFYSEAEQRWVSAMDLGEQITVSVGSSSVHLEWQEKLSCSTTELNVRKLE